MLQMPRDSSEEQVSSVLIDSPITQCTDLIFQSPNLKKKKKETATFHLNN